MRRKIKMKENVKPKNYKVKSNEDAKELKLTKCERNTFRNKTSKACLCQTLEKCIRILGYYEFRIS